MESDIENPNEQKKQVHIQKFTSTSSSKLEVENLLWALEEIQIAFSSGELISNLTIYADSQTIINLPERRQKLEQANFISGNGKELKNASLYKSFYKVMDHLNFKLIKVKGHSKKDTKTSIDKIFTLVDRAARKALKEYIGKL